MKFFEAKANTYVPSDESLESALENTTHLAIVAHQDDTEILAYSGIAECFGQQDKSFSSVIVSSGAGSPRTGIYAEYSDEEMQTIRRDEQNKAALIGGFGAQIQLAYSSSSIKDPSNANTVNDLKQIIAQSKPDVIFLHNPADKHDTHVATMVRAIAAIRSLAPEYKPKAVYGCEVWRDLDWLMDDEKVILKTGAYPNIANALIGVFDSQVSGGKRYDLATVGRRMANATYFSSHEVDTCDSMNFGIDLTPLVEDHNLTVADLVKASIQRFMDHVMNKINTVSGEA